MRNNHNKYTFSEIARMTGLHKNTIRNYYKKGMIKADKEKRGGIEVLVVSENDLYHCGVPKIIERLPQQPTQIYRNKTYTNRNKQVVSVGEENIKEFLDRIQELSIKLGGYENATLALREAREEINIYKNDLKEERKSHYEDLEELRREQFKEIYDVKQDNLSLQKRVIELQAKVYTPWWRRRRKN